MLVFGLTGGIASGKSTACRVLAGLLPDAVIFDADACVHRLLSVPGDLTTAIAASFGSEVILEEGAVDRARLRERVFKDPLAREELESLIHPLVCEECLESLEKARKVGVSLFVADIPLLFENSFDFGQDGNLLVAAGFPTRHKRLLDRSGMDESTAEAIFAAQMPQEEKIRRADHVFWNEGPISILEAQWLRFLQSHAIMSEDTQLPETPAAEQEAVALPQVIDINAFRSKSLGDLLAMAEAVPARITPGAPKAQLIFELLSFYANEGASLVGEGIVEQAKENYAMLRDPARSFRTSPDDLYVHGNLLRDHQLRPGNRVKVRIRAPRDRDKYLSAIEVLEIEGVPVAEFVSPKDFDKLTPLFPDRRIVMESDGPDAVGVRVLDLIAPLGKGQRGLIVAPPRGGKTILLKQIAKAIRRNHPEIELIVVLLDERPEEVTDFEETVGSTVYASTFDESPRRHAQVADLVIERARRLVEQGKDVVLLLDSLTRLARGHNAASQGGPIGSGGVSPVALQKSRKFFGNARNVEEGGSLTILATALIETESRMDDVIFEEFKGTGNMEVRLDRELAERRVFPAIHIPQSGTRNDDRLYHPEEFIKVLDIRRQLAQLPIGDAIETLLRNLRSTKTNAELLLRGLR
ncbi:MAG: transcription termination factor Rho [Verrucomicrobia bacterium]|nr:MAG: transcription termination factor Rho [Verrucomicrobiota bacterium]TAE86640.1 MAG: transcription termination factor Rho [Verrucomicrobiota bacterium]TAF24419.1 MAG: transcription termination factor Rho [Verrucomicrobiota bacterium]TAF39980.1 MAG: transcription termination factor Rho [Verrucomicrobiota bacterium]